MKQIYIAVVIFFLWKISNVSNMLRDRDFNVFIATLSVIALLASCHPGTGRPAGYDPIILDVNFKGRNESDTLYTSYVFSKVEYLFLDDTCKVGHITDVRITDEYAYVLDVQQSKVFQFDLSGCLVRKFSHHGRGPGEYVSLTSFDVNSSTGEVSILDLASRKVLVYSSSDEFLYTFPLPDVPRDFAVLENGDYVFCTPDYMSGVRHGIWRTDSQGRFIADLVVVPEYFKYSGGLKEKYFHHFGDVVYVAGSECYNDLYHIKAEDFSIPYHLDVDLKIPRRAVSTSLPVLDKYIGQAYTIMMYYETKDWLMLQVFDMKKPVVVMYDKETDKCFYYSDSQEIVDDMPYGGIFVSTTKDALLGVIHPEQVLAYPELRRQFPHITEQSNPIIAISYTK